VDEVDGCGVEVEEEEDGERVVTDDDEEAMGVVVCDPVDVEANVDATP